MLEASLRPRRASLQGPALLSSKQLMAISRWNNEAPHQQGQTACRIQISSRSLLHSDSPPNRISASSRHRMLSTILHQVGNFQHLSLAYTSSPQNSPGHLPTTFGSLHYGTTTASLSNLPNSPHHCFVNLCWKIVLLLNAIQRQRSARSSLVSSL